MDFGSSKKLIQASFENGFETELFLIPAVLRVPSPGELHLVWLAWTAQPDLGGLHLEVEQYSPCVLLPSSHPNPCLQRKAISTLQLDLWENKSVLITNLLWENCFWPWEKGAAPALYFEKLKNLHTLWKISFMIGFIALSHLSNDTCSNLVHAVFCDMKKHD